MSDNHEPKCGWGVHDSIPIYGSDDYWLTHPFVVASVKVFSRELTPEEIIAFHKTGQRKPWYKRLWRWLARIFRRRRSLRETILRMKPLAYWPLDEIGGGVAHDITGNCNDINYISDAMSDEGSCFGPSAKLRGKANA